MTKTPESWTWTDAVDPATPGADLAAIAGARPDLRAAVAANPATYPELRTWLGSLDDPAVDQALATAAAGPTPSAQAPTQGPPQGLGGAPAAAFGAAPGWTEAGAGQPQHQDPYGTAPQYQYPYSAQPAVGGAGFGQQAQAAASELGTTARSMSRGAVIGLVVGAVVLALAMFVVGFAVGRATASVGSGFQSDHDRCASGDMSACDDLWYDTPFGSSEENFAGTCGNRATYEAATCELRFGSQY